MRKPFNIFPEILSTPYRPSYIQLVISLYFSCVSLLEDNFLMIKIDLFFIEIAHYWQFDKFLFLHE